jgi:hypothetical protein
MVRWLYLSRQLWIAIALTVLFAGLVALRAAQTGLIPRHFIPLFVAAHATGPFAAFIMFPTRAIASPVAYLISAGVLFPIVYFEYRPRRWLRPIALVAYVAWFILGSFFAYAQAT